MGVSWYSKAEVVTTEPEIVKDLILQIANEDTAPVHNLEIKGNSIFFDSDGYNCFGVEWENYADALLFERLFEQYVGALICFEAVSPCQQQGYFFSSTWIKPEGEVSWDDDEIDEDDEDEIDEKTQNFYKYSRVLWIEGDVSKEPDEGNFNIADIWYITFDYLERNKEVMPNLYAAYLKAKADGFDDWPINWNNKEKGISYETAQILGDIYSDNQDDILEDCLENMGNWNCYPIDTNGDFEFELPENFPNLSILS